MMNPENNGVTFKLLKENNCQPGIQMPPKMCPQNRDKVKVLIFYCGWNILLHMWWHTL